jgi:hypothetical protein
MILLTALLALAACGSQEGQESAPTERTIPPPPDVLVPQSVRYQRFDGQTVDLYAWEGRNVALLTESNALDPEIVEFLLDGLDKAYDYYRSASPRAPTPLEATTYHGKATIAEVQSTCGAGCGYLGFTGIEIQSHYFDVLYNTAKDDGLYNHVPFYELGRNFWLYQDKLSYVAPDDITAVITGFAVLMRSLSLERRDLPGGPVDSALSWDEFTQEWLSMADTYIANSAYTWDNTLRIGRGVPGDRLNLSAADLFAALLYETARRYDPLPSEIQEGPDFFQRLWINVSHRPDRRSTQDALDNLILAACETVNRNLTGYFSTTLRWPISPAALMEARQRFGNPVP